MSQYLCIVFVTEKPTVLPYYKIDTDKAKDATGATGATDATGATSATSATSASGEGVINSYAFTKKTLLENKTEIITIQDYEELEKLYKNKPYFNLFMFTIFDTKKRLLKDKSQLCCLIIFMNDVYSYHYVCNIDTIEESKQSIKDIIHRNNMDIKTCSLMKINFNENGTFKAFNDEPFN